MADRAIETKVHEVKDDNGNVVQRITETWVEKVPMELKNRVVEHISTMPVVLEKTVENFEDGQVIDSHHESLTSVSKVSAMSVEEPQIVRGLSEMKQRVLDTSKKGTILLVGLYCVIAVLVGYIAFQLI